MDRHYLTPLFAPRSLVVFAGPDEDPARQTDEARALRAALAGPPAPQLLAPPVFLHVGTTGTLAELAESTLWADKVITF
jgi:acetyltransferase